MNGPVRERFLRALAQRLAAQPEAVQRRLRDKFGAELVALEAACVDAPPRPVTRRTPAPQVRSGGPLAQLQRTLRESAATRSGGTPGDPVEADELASVRRFRQTWAQGRSLEQVEQALARKPAQAGPLNSHALVLQSLDLMRSLSPDYLRHFLAHVEALQWIEQAPGPTAREPDKAKAKRTPRRGGKPSSSRR